MKNKGLQTRNEDTEPSQASFATLAEMAVHVGMSERSVNYVLTDTGMKLGEVTLDQFRLAYIRQLREQAAGRAPNQADARKKEAEATLKELELAERRNDLIDRAGYLQAIQTTMRMLRDALVEVLPAKLAVELAALSDPWPIECRVRDGIRNELAAVTGNLESPP